MKNNKSGFTLIELLVVVLIIGILAAVALPSYKRAVLKARYVQLMTMGDALYRAAEAYRMETGEWPSDPEALVVSIPGATISSNKPDRFKADKFYCDVTYNNRENQTHGIVCAFHDLKPGIFFRRYFSEKVQNKPVKTNRFCLEKDSDLSVQGFCKSIGAETPYHHTAGGSNSATGTSKAYLLP